MGSVKFCDTPEGLPPSFGEPSRPMLRAAIYTRVSTDAQETEGLSLPAQLAECTRYAHAAGYAQATHHSDPGLSGALWERPGLQALLASLVGIDAVIVWSLDRLSRDVGHLSRIMDALRRAGVALLSVSEQVDIGSASGRLVAGVHGVIGQYEREHLQERVRLGLGQRTERGLHSGPAPYGYTPNPDKHAPMTVDEPRATIVRELFRRYGRGESMVDLRTWLRGVAPERKWGLASIRLVLSNPAYTGLLHRKAGNVPGQHKAIVSQASFSRAQERLRRAREVHPLSRVRTYAAVLRCGVCGSRMGVHNAVGGGMYRCLAQMWLPREERDHRQFHRRPKLDAILWEMTRRIVDVGSGLPTGAPDAGPLRELRIEETRLESELGRVLRVARGGQVAEDVLTAETADLAAALETVRARIAAQTDRLDREREARRVMGRKLPGNLTVGQQVDIMRAIWKKVDVHADRLEFWHRLFPEEVIVHPVPRRWDSRTGLRGLGFEE